MHLLNPITFRHYSQDGELEQMDPDVAAIILPSILKMIQLRRTMTTQIEVNRTLEQMRKFIPSYFIKIVELCWTKQQYLVYQPQYDRLIAKFARRADSSTKKDKLNMATHRRLCILTLNSGLKAVLEYGKLTLQSYSILHGILEDYGASYYFNLTRGYFYSPPYDIRGPMAIHLAGLSLKIRYLTRLVYNICVKRGENVIVFVDWPINLWFVTMYLRNLSIPLWRYERVIH